MASSMGIADDASVRVLFQERDASAAGAGGGNKKNFLRSGSLRESLVLMDSGTPADPLVPYGARFKNLWRPPSNLPLGPPYRWAHT